MTAAPMTVARRAMAGVRSALAVTVTVMIAVTVMVVVIGKVGVHRPDRSMPA
ncbi:hypothetical protein [Streptomyces sp. NPDC097619]|uniref:hypothetical protein n=1 Tax=Streptomyces sp. NPDC097619 TaxID=3157228 RepID=UPI003323E89D